MMTLAVAMPRDWLLLVELILTRELLAKFIICKDPLIPKSFSPLSMTMWSTWNQRSIVQKPHSWREDLKLKKDTIVYGSWLHVKHYVKNVLPGKTFINK